MIRNDVETMQNAVRASLGLNGRKVSVHVCISGLARVEQWKPQQPFTLLRKEDRGGGRRRKDKEEECRADVKQKDRSVCLPVSMCVCMYVNDGVAKQT